jgi:hypothetical protein
MDHPYDIQLIYTSLSRVYYITINYVKVRHNLLVRVRRRQVPRRTQPFPHDLMTDTTPTKRTNVSQSTNLEIRTVSIVLVKEMTTHTYSRRNIIAHLLAVDK